MLLEHRHLPYSAPISKLNQDVIWEIFANVADMPSLHPDIKMRAITCLRYISQVCASWRRLTVNSASLWGRVIHLESLNQKTDFWRKEVMRRTGRSELFVEGILNGDISVDTFLDSLLDEHWTRIRYLDIQLRARSIHEHKWRTVSFQRPAPHLEYFRVCFHDTNPTIKSRIFEDDAPSLRAFTATHVEISPQAPWLSHLHTLHFLSSFSARQLLDVLSNIPLLEDLEIFNDEDQPPPLLGALPLPRANLPCLYSLSIEAGNGLRAYIAVLDHLVSAPGCTFNFSSFEAELLTESEMAEAHRAVSTYLKSCLKQDRSFQVSLTMDPRLLYFEFCEPSFQFSVAFNDGHPEAILKFLPPFSSPAFADVSLVTLDINGFELLSVDPNFIRLISSFVSAEKLAINPEGISILIDVQDKLVTILFPLIKTVTFSFIDELDESAVLGFFLQRRDLGLPIQVLELSLIPRRKFFDFAFLEKVEGLRVSWRLGESRQEYTCGSGQPHVLDFT